MIAKRVVLSAWIVFMIIIPAIVTLTHCVG